MLRSTDSAFVMVLAMVVAPAAFAQLPGSGRDTSGPAGQMGDRGGTIETTANSPADLVNTRRAATNAENAIRERQRAVQHNMDERASKAVPAVAADLKVGATVFDLAAVELGTIETVGPDGVRIALDHGHATVPAVAISKYRKQLMIKTTKADFEARVAAAADGK